MFKTHCAALYIYIYIYIACQSIMGCTMAFSSLSRLLCINPSFSSHSSQKNSGRQIKSCIEDRFGDSYEALPCDPCSESLPPMRSCDAGTWQQLDQFHRTASTGSDVFNVHRHSSATYRKV